VNLEDDKGPAKKVRRVWEALQSPLSSDKVASDLSAVRVLLRVYRWSGLTKMRVIMLAGMRNITTGPAQWKVKLNAAERNNTSPLVAR